MPPFQSHTNPWCALPSRFPACRAVQGLRPSKHHPLFSRVSAPGNPPFDSGGSLRKAARASNSQRWWWGLQAYDLSTALSLLPHLRRSELTVVIHHGAPCPPPHTPVSSEQGHSRSRRQGEPQSRILCRRGSTRAEIQGEAIRTGDEVSRPLRAMDQEYRRGRAIDVCSVVLAVLLPPLGVFLKRECQAEFWICLLLTLFG